MAIKVGINGFGRIGRMVFRAAVADFAKDIEIVGINDLLEPNYLAYMLKYDSVHGPFKGEIAVDGNNLVISGKKIRLTAEKDPANLKWGDVGADIVVESTGIFLEATGVRLHLPQWLQTPHFPRFISHPKYIYIDERSLSRHREYCN